MQKLVGSNPISRFCVMCRDVSKSTIYNQKRHAEANLHDDDLLFLPLLGLESSRPSLSGTPRGQVSRRGLSGRQAHRLRRDRVGVNELLTDSRQYGDEEGHGTD
jgi:hypothetical protein